MLNKKIKSLIFICSLSALFSQSISMRQIEQLSNNQIDTIKEELKSNSVSGSVSDSIIEDVENNLADVNLTPVKKEKILENFGYSYFQRSVNFFDNIPVPTEFRIGPGDELILSIWGETNVRKKFVINRDGSFFYENIGFINLNNKTLEEAESILSDRLSQIYSTINNDIKPTKLSLEFGQIKSINVYFTGETNNPGINLIHPLSDVFSALVQAGIKETGSLRNVQLIRKGEIVNTFDFYKFFVDGQNNFSKIRIFDGDIIHIPVVANRVQIKGGTTRLGYFELIGSDTVSDLLKYAGGLRAIVSDVIIVDRIIPANQRISDDNARSRDTILISEASNHSLNNGDWISIPAITEVETDAIIYGRVKNPGNYPAKNRTLKDILKLAGGFDDPIFRKTIKDDEIIILRKDSNQFYSQEFKVEYKDAESFQLNVGDKIFIYENINYENSFTFRIQGEVNKPGTYPLKKGYTVRDVISIAGGLTELSTINNITVSQEYTQLNELDQEITIVENVANVSLDFEVGSNSVVSALPFENVVRVEGNVYKPGLVAYSRNLTMAEAIIQAGGYKPHSFKKRAYVRKANGEIDQANIFRGRAKRLDAGDTVIVPADPNPTDFNIGELTTDVLSILTNLVAILAIIDNNSNN